MAPGSSAGGRDVSQLWRRENGAPDSLHQGCNGKLDNLQHAQLASYNLEIVNISNLPSVATLCASIAGCMRGKSVLHNTT